MSITCTFKPRSSFVSLEDLGLASNKDLGLLESLRDFFSRIGSMGRPFMICRGHVLTQEDLLVTYFRT